MKTLTLESTITELLTEMNKTQPILLNIDDLATALETETITPIVEKFIESQIEAGIETDTDPLSGALTLFFTTESGQEIMMYADADENESCLELNE